MNEITSSRTFCLGENVRVPTEDGDELCRITNIIHDHIIVFIDIYGEHRKYHKNDII